MKRMTAWYEKDGKRVCYFHVTEDAEMDTLKYKKTYKEVEYSIDGLVVKTTRCVTGNDYSNDATFCLSFFKRRVLPPLKYV